MSLIEDYYAVSGKVEDPVVLGNLEGIQYILNELARLMNSGVTKNFNTSATYAITVTNGIITAIT